MVWFWIAVGVVVVIGLVASRRRRGRSSGPVADLESRRRTVEGAVEPYRQQRGHGPEHNRW